MRIAVDTAGLADMAARLRELRATFDGMEDHIEGETDAVGHEHLADRLVEFADNWSHTRDEVGEQLDAVAAGAAGAGEAFAECETDSARSYRTTKP